MKCAFTICTYSYFGLANVLKKSFLKHHNDYDFYIVFIDKKDDDKYSVLCDEILDHFVARTKTTDMRFKYDVTEYSTSVKPFAFRYFFLNGYDKVLYFDPDISVYSALTEVTDNEYDAYVTPHKLLYKQQCGDGIESETSALKYGLFNCGFIGFNNTSLSISFLEFWSSRLLDFSFNDPENGVYTDQKWVDLIQIIMRDKVKIIPNIGYNYAPWNMNERKIVIKGNTFYIKLMEKEITEPLVFMHFSGFNYPLLENGTIKHSFREFESYSDLDIVLLEYGNELKTEKATEYMKEKYSYNYYTNGVMISKINRRLYRQLCREPGTYGNPFDSSEAFYALMKKNGLLAKNRLDAKVNNTKNIGGKTKAIQGMLILFKVLLGVDKYTELIRALHKYSTYEMQTFLIK